MSESNRLFARWSALKKEVTVKDGCGMRVLDLGPGAIPRGRLVCVLGPSGCGKTSLLSILGLVDHEFEGDLGVELGGRFQPIGQWRGRKRQRESARLRRHIGFVFQEMRLRAGASAVENVMDPMLYLGFGTPRTRYSHAKSMLGLFGLQDRDIERPISCFSGGMQQRTGLAR
ncbi:MAG TPA: ATP-binding cassette domain-containing protein, partial [Myxococcota bacterium]|nr:ATP-binding cassette domain-containing protein [Myxococcota bacterium]